MDKNYKDDYGLLLLGALGGIIGGVGFAYETQNAPNEWKTIGLWGETICLLIGDICILAMIVLTVKIVKNKTNSGLTKFYNECLASGITDCLSEKNIQRAKLIADNNNLHYSDITMLFNKAKDLHDGQSLKDKNRKENELIKAKKKEESLLYNRLVKYSGFSGRDKRIQMLTDEMNEALREAKVLREGSDQLLNMLQEKESDWAIQGGIASAIAGPFAGLATAAEAQARNKEIREKNAKTARIWSSTRNNSYDMARKREDLAKKIQAEIEKTKVKLVSSEDANICFSNISFSNTEIRVTETGTIIVNTVANLKNSIRIYDDVEAVVDGTIIANIYDGKEMVGNALLVLPTYGVKGETELTGVCLYRGSVDRSYTVELVPKNLWLIEI